VAPTPAYASRTFDLICELVDTGNHYKIMAVAYYVDNTIGPGLRRWYEFQYKFTTPLGTTRNNVNIRLSESGQQVYAYNSPDDRREGVWYMLRPDRLVLTSIWGPQGEHDHRANDLIEFEAIFDIPHDGDPHCTAWTLV
jgi:hypothetical protein